MPTIAPKPTVEIPPEYLNAFSGNDIPQQTGLKNVVYPKTTKKLKTKEKTADTVPCQNTIEISAAVASNTKKSLPNDFLEEDEEPLSKITSVSQSNAKTSNEQSTPPVVEHAQKTPRSGSHVRNLDFSTPPKMTSTHQKSSKNKVNNDAPSKSPTFIHKKQAAKTLFYSQNCVSDHECKISDTSKKHKTWDADLRAAVLPMEEEKFTCNTSKKKRKTPIKKVKKTAKKIKVMKRQLNTTEQNAALIEAALQTPIKSGTGEGTNSEQADNDSKKENHVGKANDEEKINNLDNCETNNVTSNNDNIAKLTECQVKQSNGCCTNKMVLSPSKLNANKRKLMGPDITDNNANDSLKLADETNRFITPEMVKENFHYPIKANRNITSLFETPLKNDFPKTPGSPNITVNTPFTKMLEANLKGIDISSLPTPNIPITPNFPPFTPNVEISPYSNRPTDYSTSSSYYQPSDSEPNRSLEANVIELEKQSVAGLNDATVAKKIEIQENIQHRSDTLKTVNCTVDERLKIFNGSIIGKKNLNLVKRNISSNSSSSDSSSDSFNEEDNASSCNWVEKSNETIIYNKKAPETPKRIYSLRNRTTSTTVSKKEEVTKISEVKESAVKKSGKNMKSNVRSTNKHVEESNIPHKSEKSLKHQVKNEKEEVELKEKGSSQLARLQKELHEKLSRTVNEIKTAEKHTKKTTKPARNSKGKFMKIKLVGLAKRRRKSDASPKKIAKKDSVNMENDLHDTKSDNLISQRKNKKDDKDEKTICLPTIEEPEKIDKSASDIEAQNLIEGLKERGIHLVKNKSSPGKKINGTSNLSELDKDPNNESGASKCIIENNSNEENQHERSSAEIETEWRETYDTMTFEGEYECVVFNESKKITKTFENFDTAVLEKKFIGNVFIENMNEPIGIPLVVSPFYTLLDIPPLRNPTQKQNVPSQRVKASDKKTGEKTANKDFTEKPETNKKNSVVEGDHIPTASSREEREGSEAPR